MLVFVASVGSVAEGRVRRKVNPVYCVRSSQGTWQLQSFRPLLNGHAKMELTELEFEGDRLASARVRRLFPDYEADFEYRFDPGGQLTGLMGWIEVWSKWIGRRDLFPNPDGSTPESRIKYFGTESESEIPRPEFAANYTQALESYPVYRTVEALPCGGDLKAAVRMNAASK